MAADCILDNIADTDKDVIVELFNQMAEQDNSSIRVYKNTPLSLAEEVLTAMDPWHVLLAAMNGGWTESDAYCYTRQTQRGTELYSFSYLTDNDCPIYLSELLDWLEREDFAPLAEIVYNDYAAYGYMAENAFRMFAEEDEGFSPVGIGIFIGQHGGVVLDENWDNYIIEMYSE